MHIKKKLSSATCIYVNYIHKIKYVKLYTTVRYIYHSNSPNRQYTQINHGSLMIFQVEYFTLN